MTEEKRHRSVSQLTSYTSCGMAYKLERIDKRPSPPAAWTLRGTVFHHLVERWDLSDRTLDWREALEDEWNTEFRRQQALYPDLDRWIRTPNVKSTERDLELRKADVYKQFEWYEADALTNQDQWEVYRLPNGRKALELEFKIKLSPDSPFFLTGYIDMLKYWKDSGAVTIADFKTGGDDREDYRQLGTYRVALQEEYGIETRWGEYVYPKLERSSGWIDLSRYTRECLDATYSTLDRAIESEIFLANPKKKQCQMFCGVRQFCPEMRDR